ncbi:MAG TPA: hypothetical protein VNW04_10310 [Puia sp.]|nr:hypothetical protein [Puia sp.]
MITRDNYEEYFLLYVDSELPAAARLAVEQFVTANPHLREELDSLLQCRVHPDQHEVFHDRETLLQQDLLSYIDGELDADGRRAVEEFVTRYPSKAVELQQLSMTVSQPDLSILHPDKESLYRSQRKRVLFMPWMQAGIAAAVLGLVALLLFTNRHPEAPRLANSDHVKKNIPVAVTPAVPAPLYSSGNDDHGRTKVVVKNDLPKQKEQQPAKAPARVPTTITPATATDILPSEPVVAVEIHPDAVEKTLIKPAITVAAVNIPKEQSSFATQALLAEAQADETKEVATAAPAGRSKLRGLFRRVSRTFGKTADRDDNGQKEVLISAFQVELK